MEIDGRDKSEYPESDLSSVIDIFLPYIKKRASRLIAAGLDSDDFIQEGLIGLHYAILNYRPDGAASFSTYAITCIDNRLNSALRSAARKKNLPLSGYKSLSESEEFDDFSANSESPEDMAIIKEEFRLLIDKIEKSLSRFEKDVLNLYLEGYSYLSIAELLRTTPKSVDNALQRARRKLTANTT